MKPLKILASVDSASNVSDSSDISEIFHTNDRKAVPVGVTQQTIGMFVFLTLIVGLFSPWEDYVNHLEFSLGAAPAQKSFSVSRTIILMDYVVVLVLASINVKSVLSAFRYVWPILLVCAWILLSSRWSVDPSGSLNRGGRLLFSVFFAWYVAARYGSVEFVVLLTRSYAIVAFASLAIMVLAPDLGYSGLGGENSMAWRGALTHKNSLGAAMAFGSVISGYSFRRRANSRLFSAFTLLACLVLLVMSRSVTALLSTIVAFLVSVTGEFLQSRTRVPVLPAFAFGSLGLLMVLVLLWPIFDIDLSYLPGLAGRSGSLSGRTEVWHAVRIAIRERSLLGYGYGFWDLPSVMRNNIWLYLNWGTPHAHSNWLDAWLQIGLIGLILTITTWLIPVGRAAWLTVIGHSHVALFYLTILCCALAQSYAETIQFSPGISAVFWWAACYLLIARIAHQRTVARQSFRANLPSYDSAQGQFDAARF